MLPASKRHWRESAQECVLCWLATANAKGEPNVSPKEVFYDLDDHTLIIANIASPQSSANLAVNSSCAVSIVNIFSQMGHQVKGRGSIIYPQDPEFAPLAKPITTKISGRFVLRGLFKIAITETKPILAPSYQFYPDTTIESQIANARLSYLNLS